MQAQYNGASGVGFAEVGIPGVRPMRCSAADRSADPGRRQSLQHELMLQMTRDRANPAEPFKDDTEKSMARTFSLPTARAFA